MKSSWPSNSAFVRASPLATPITCSRIVSPIFSMLVSPVMMLPVSMSMMSAIRRARFEFVAIFKTGAIGFPVGVPRPVVKRTTFAPAPTCAETDFHVVSRRAMQIQSRLRGIFRIIEHGGNGRCAALLRRARGFHRIRQQTVLDIPRRRIHLEAREHSFGARCIIPHELRKTLRNLSADAAIDKLLFDTAELGEFGKDAYATERRDYIGDVANRGIRRQPGKTVGAPALQTPV